ncbi:MAG: hypothetical protein RL145_1828 [Pseudomonadota bacterium]|jgi:hypothetical protein
MHKIAEVSLCKGRYFVAAYNEVITGGAMIDDLIVELDSGDENEMRLAVEAALARSRFGIPVPPEPAEKQVPPMLKVTGCRSWAERTRLSKIVDVQLENKVITVTPMENGGRARGHVWIEEAEVKIPEGSPDLGKIILQAFKIAT